jgi:predicted dehydrogenase
MPPEIRVLVVGGGEVVQFVHLPALMAEENGHLLGIVSSRVDDSLPDAIFYADWRTAILESKPDLTVIATPNALHYEMAYFALYAGSHVLLEKPAYLIDQPGHDLLRFSSQLGLHVGVNSSLTLLKFVRDFIAETKTCGRSKFVKVFLKYHISRPNSRWYFEKHLAGAGVVACLGTHVLDILLAMESEPPSQLVIKTAPLSSGIEVEDAASFQARFPNGTLATADLSWCAEELDFSLRIESAITKWELTIGPGNHWTASRDGTAYANGTFWDTLINESAIREMFAIIGGRTHSPIHLSNQIATHDMLWRAYSSKEIS